MTLARLLAAAADWLMPGRRLVSALLADPGGCVALLDRNGVILRSSGGWNVLPPVGARAWEGLAEPAPERLRGALADGGDLRLTTRVAGAPATLSLTGVAAGRWGAGGWGAASLGAERQGSERVGAGRTGAQRPDAQHAWARRWRAGRVAGVLRLTSCAREHELEERLGQAQRLHEVGELAGGIAHDFNNLLTAILGAVEDLTAHAAERDLEDLAQIRASAGRGAQLVRQILAFGQRQTMLPRVLVLDEAVTQAAQLLRRLLGRHVALELDLQAPSRRVLMDATQLDQVLVNLAVNARNAMSGGGTLRIATGWRMVLAGDGHEADALPPGRYATIEVSDTGGGIPPEVLPRIFDPFFTTRRGQGGTGLGLSMVQGIVAQSGGTLSVHSVLGEGTRFCITLPRYEGAAAPVPARPHSLLEPPARREAARDTEPKLIGLAQAEQVEASNVGKAGLAGEAARAGGIVRAGKAGGVDEVRRAGEVGRVLLVDDDDAIRRLAKRTLSRAGWSVIEADGAEAALAVDLEAIDCVVSDVSMPGMDGPSLVRTLRESRANLPALLISGYADAEQRRSLAVEDIAFLAKPFAMAELSGTVARLLPPRVGVLDAAR